MRKWPTCGLLLTTLGLAVAAHAQISVVNTISTLESGLNTPTGVAVDSSGNVYIMDEGAGRLYRVDATTGEKRVWGDDFNCAYGVAVDSDGNVYVADGGNERIVKYTDSFTYTSVAGGSMCSSSTDSCGDGQLATQAQFHFPYGVAVDSAGNIYVADTKDNRIRKVTKSTGIISTVAGTGTQGSNAADGNGGPATSANLYSPTTVTVDGSGNLYFADYGGEVRKVDASTGYISTVAGIAASTASGDGGLATKAYIGIAYGVVVDKQGNLYIADTDNNRIRKVANFGYISTVAGNGTSSYSGDGGSATSATISSPWGIAVDSSGNLYFADVKNKSIRKVDISDGRAFPTTAVGSTSTAQDILLQTTAALNITSISAPTSIGSKQEFTVGTVSGCTVDSTGATSTASATTCTIPVTFTPGYPGTRNIPLQVTSLSGTTTTTYSFALHGSGVGPQAGLTPGIISTVAGTGTAKYNKDGVPATSANLWNPLYARVDSVGNIYIADYSDSRIRKVDAITGYISTVAGNGTAGYSGDGGLATSAKINHPDAIAFDHAGNLYFNDSYNYRVRKVDAITGYISTVAGTGKGGYSGDGGLATSAKLYDPEYLAFDSANNLYMAEYKYSRVRKVDAVTGIISTAAGTGTASYTGDGGLATSATLNQAWGVAFDRSDNLYIADYYNNVIRKVTRSTGIISTVAGTGTKCSLATLPCGNGGLATSATLLYPISIDFDVVGNLYILDINGTYVRKIEASTGIIEGIAGVPGSSGETGDGGSALNADLGDIYSISLDAAGNIYFPDYDKCTVRKVNVGSSILSWSTTTSAGTTDSTDGVQDATVYNSGNADLTFSVPATGTNASLSTGYTLGSTSTCPELSVSSSSSTLASGASCTYAIDFTPTSTQSGTVSGSLVITDDSLNAASPSYATQTISLSGTAVAITLLPTSLTDDTYGTAYSQSFTASGGTPPYTYSTTSTLPDGLTLSSAGVLSGTLTTAGTYSFTITATDSNSYYGSWSYTLVVNQAAATVSVWPTASAITYGQTLASSMLTGGTASVAGSFAFTTPTTAPAVGTASYSVTFTPTDTTAYSALTGTVSVKVMQATPTLSEGTGAARLNYGAAGQIPIVVAAPSDSYTKPTGSISYSIDGGTTQSAAISSQGYAYVSMSASLTAGSHSIVVAYGGDTNYVAATSITLNVTINTAVLVITPTSQTKHYGETLSLTAFTTSGLQNSDAVSSVTLISPGTSATATVGSSYPITASGATGTGLSNYSITYATIGTVTVSAASLTITPTSVTKTYGSALSLNAFTTSGLQNSDAVSSVTLTSPGTAATATVGSSYSITASGATGTGLSNYSINYATTGTVTVSAASLTITPTSVTKTYGSALSLTAFATSGLQNSDAVSSVTLTSLGTSATATAGSSYSITASGATGTGLSNYSITYATTGTVTVSAASLTITPTSVTKTYGSALSLTAFATSGLQNSDAVSSVTLTSPGTVATATVGSSYPITASGATGTGLSNYSISYATTGTVTVSAASLTITPTSVTKTYGSALSLTAFTTSGLQNSDAVSSVTLTSLGTSATAAAGSSYPITASGAMGTSLSNYSINYATTGTVTVTKAATTTTLSFNDTTTSLGTSATLTAQVASVTSGTPTDTVSFYSGTTLLGSGILSGNTASYTATLAAGSTYSLTAVYNGDTNFATSTSNTVSVTSASLDYTLTASGSTTQTVVPGGAVSYKFSIAPEFSSYAGTVSFTASGLPTGATAIFSPATISATGGAQTVTMTIQTAATTAHNAVPTRRHRAAPLALALFFLPLLGTKRMRRQGRKMSRWICLLVLVSSMAATAALAGCGGSYFSQAQKDYTVTVTATAGSLQHSFNVTLNVQ